MGDLISRSAVIKVINAIDLDNPGDDKEDILEKAIGRVDHFPTAYDTKEVEQKLFQNSYTETVNGECIRAIRFDVAIDIVRNAGKDGAE